VDSSIVPLLTGSAGAAGVTAAVVILMILGVLVPKAYVTKLEKRIGYLEQALESEKQISKESVSALASSNQMIGTLKQIAIERRAEHFAADGSPAAHRDEMGLTWDDLS
jgi:hypothetical protein